MAEEHKDARLHKQLSFLFCVQKNIQVASGCVGDLIANGCDLEARARDDNRATLVKPLGAISRSCSAS